MEGSNTNQEPKHKLFCSQIISSERSSCSHSGLLYIIIRKANFSDFQMFSIYADARVALEGWHSVKCSRLAGGGWSLPVPVVGRLPWGEHTTFKRKHWLLSFKLNTFVTKLLFESEPGSIWTSQIFNFAAASVKCLERRCPPSPPPPQVSTHTPPQVNSIGSSSSTHHPPP